MEEREKQKLLDREREKELGRIEAELTEKLEAIRKMDTDSAINLIAKVEDFLTSITTSKSGLFAIRISSIFAFISGYDS